MPNELDMYRQLETVYETIPGVPKVDEKGEPVLDKDGKPVLNDPVVKEKYTDEGLLIKKDPEYPTKPVYPRKYNGPTMDNENTDKPVDQTF